MGSNDTLEATIGADGSLVVTAAELDRVGVRPGDRVRVEPVRPRRVRSMLGYGADPRGFSNDHLRQIRTDMGRGLGEDLTA